METAPDFDALRAERNKKVAEAHQRLADELGVPLQTLRSNHNPTFGRCCKVENEMDDPNMHAYGEDGPDDAEIGRQWRENSSLEKWFPFTAEQLEAKERENLRLAREARTWWEACRDATGEAERRYNKFKAVEAENAALEMALRQLLAAAMPIRADRATLQDVARAIPALYDACHSAAITLNLK